MLEDARAAAGLHATEDPPSPGAARAHGIQDGSMAQDTCVVEEVQPTTEDHDCMPTPNEYFMVSLSRDVSLEVGPSAHAVEAQATVEDEMHADTRTEDLHGSAGLDEAGDREGLEVDHSVRPEEELNSDVVRSLSVTEMGHGDESAGLLHSELLLAGMTSQEAAAFAKMKAFCSNIVKKLAPPCSKKFKKPRLTKQTPI